MKNTPSPIKDPSQFAVLKILTGKNKGKQFRLLGAKVLIGRSPDCDIILKDNPSCSREHALIRYNHQEKIYIIESLNPQNPVVVNKKTIQSHNLKRKDEISIGSLLLEFFNQSQRPSSNQGYQQLHKDHLKQQQAKKKKTIRIFFIGLIVAIGLILFSKTESNKQQAKKGLKTEEDILREIELVEELNQKEIQKQKVSHTSKQARKIFLKAFRDYRKGHYYRASKQFEHCLTIQKQNKLCKSYANKSKTQLQKLIQRKVVLGKSYKDKKQYAACVYTFKGVEMMIQDADSPVFKEARAYKNLCQSKIKNIF